MTDTEAKLHRLIQLAACMPNPREILLPIKAGTTARAHPSGVEGLPFHFDQALDFYDTASADPRGIRSREGVQVWAGAWAYAWWVAADREGPEPSGDMLAHLNARLVWAQAHFPGMAEFEAELDVVIRVVGQACGLTPIPTGRACPACDGGLVRRVTPTGVEERLSCTECGAVFEPEGLQALQRMRLRQLCEQEDWWLPRSKVAALLGVTSHRLRVWISRGRLDTDADGHINLRAAARLLLDIATKT